MVIKSIISICKRERQMRLFDDNRTEGAVQWLGTGAALYPMQRMPRLDGNSIFTAFDITGNQADKIFFRRDSLPESFDFRDVVECENILESDDMEIRYAGTTLRPLHTSMGIKFINTEYLRPLADCDADMLELYERTTANGDTYIAAKVGMMLLEIILPFDAVNEEFVEKLRGITSDCEIALSVKKEAGK